MEKSGTNNQRRLFLGFVAGLPALAAAALLHRRKIATPETAPPAPQADMPDSVGYHETEHIRKYYRSAAYF